MDTRPRAQQAEQLQDVEATLPWPRRPQAALTALAKVAQASWQARSPEFAEGIRRLVPAVEFLTSRWRQTRGPVRNCSSKVWMRIPTAFEQVYAAKDLTDPVRRLFAAVVTDVEVKAQHCAQSTRGWAELIEVRVNTLGADGKAVSGQEVWSCPARVGRYRLTMAALSPGQFSCYRSTHPGVYLVRPRRHERYSDTGKGRWRRRVDCDGGCRRGMAGHMPPPHGYPRPDAAGCCSFRSSYWLALTAALLKPPSEVARSDGAALAGLVGAVLVLLAIAATATWSSRRHLWRWFGAAVVLLTVAVVLQTMYT